jgi:hypothetical protein
MIFSIAKKGKEFSSDDVSNAFKQLKDCKEKSSRIQRSIDQITNEIKSR